MALLPDGDEFAKQAAAHISLALLSVEKLTQTKENRNANEALKAAAQARNNLKKANQPDLVLDHALEQNLNLNHPILNFTSKNNTNQQLQPNENTRRRSNALPETEMLLGKMLLVRRLDAGDVQGAVTLGQFLIDRLASVSRRTLDQLAERIYFFTSLAYERAGRLAEVRAHLLAAQRSAYLHHYTACQATLLNLLLRSYIASKQYLQAEKLLSKSTFPEQASNCQLARYLYYTGRIKMIQLEYTDAHRCLLQAQRKAPQSTSRAIGFKLSVYKLSTIVQLLLGEVPDRDIFRAPATRAAMQPYLRLVQAVRLGQLQAFRAAMQTHTDAFEEDGNLSLVIRLRQNVIRTGLRNISLAYSRISLAEAASKLSLEDSADMQLIAAKAIRDGVIDSTIDQSAAVLISGSPRDACATFEPQAAFHKRITYCLNLHNEAVRAMSYPAGAHKGELPSAEAVKERQREEQELMESMGEEDF